MQFHASQVSPLSEEQIRCKSLLRTILTSSLESWVQCHSPFRGCLSPRRAYLRLRWSIAYKLTMGKKAWSQSARVPILRNARRCTIFGYNSHCGNVTYTHNVG